MRADGGQRFARPTKTKASMKTQINKLLLLSALAAGLALWLPGRAAAQSLTVLQNFTGTGGAAPGSSPSAGLTLSGSTLYGTTVGGGSSGAGTVFKVNTDGSGYTVLQNFDGGRDGGYPQASLTLSGSTLYGTTANGGGSGNGTVFKIGTDKSWRIRNRPASSSSALVAPRSNS